MFLANLWTNWGRSPARPCTRFTARLPLLDQQSTTLEMFETGIKVVDLIQPFLKGGKIGLFGGAGAGKRFLFKSSFTT